MTPAKTIEPKAKKATPAADKLLSAVAPKTTQESEKKAVAPKAVKPQQAETPKSPKPSPRKSAPAGAAAVKPKKAPAAKQVARPAEAAPAPVSPEHREKMINEMAYYLAEQRGFNGGSAHDDWVAAEAAVDRMLAETPAK